MNFANDSPPNIERFKFAWLKGLARPLSNQYNSAATTMILIGHAVRIIANAGVRRQSNMFNLMKVQSWSKPMRISAKASECFVLLILLKSSILMDSLITDLDLDIRRSPWDSSTRNCSNSSELSLSISISPKIQIVWIIIRCWWIYNNSVKDFLRDGPCTIFGSVYRLFKITYN